MNLLVNSQVGQWSIERSEAMTWMLLIGRNNAVRAVVKVWAGQTLVTNSTNTLVAAITDSRMMDTASRGTKSLDFTINGVFNSLMECMGRIMSMFTLREASQTKVKIGTVITGDKFTRV